MRWYFCRTCWSHIREDLLPNHKDHDVRYDKGWRTAEVIRVEAPDNAPDVYADLPTPDLDDFVF